MSDPQTGAYEFVGEFHQKRPKAASSQIAWIAVLATAVIVLREVLEALWS